MKTIFVTKLIINKIRHLKEIEIPLSDIVIKQLVLTGKNGSGKTSVLDELASVLNFTFADNAQERMLQRCYQYLVQMTKQPSEAGRDSLSEIPKVPNGISLQFNVSQEEIQKCFQNGECIIAYYKADRNFQADIPKHIEKIDLKDTYNINETPREFFLKYLVDLKITEALAKTNFNYEKAEKIREWFEQFQNLLRNIFEDDSLELKFNEDNFSFTIHEKNREPFDFNTLSSGFAAILDIVLDLIIRMEKKANRKFCFDLPGIVLIDEIETHLHIELQKNVLNLLTTIFPNIQFIVSTHSPFILSSLDNMVIYDLENHTLVENGLSNVPYEGIVEGYFKADTMSDLLKEKFERYKELVQKKVLTDNDFEEIAELEMFLDEIPDYLALDLTTEYHRLKLELENREDI